MSLPPVLSHPLSHSQAAFWPLPRPAKGPYCQDGAGQRVCLCQSPGNPRQALRTTNPEFEKITQRKPRSSPPNFLGSPSQHDQ